MAKYQNIIIKAFVFISTTLVINAFTLPGLHQIKETDRIKRDVDTTTDPPSDPCVVLSESAMLEAGASAGAHHNNSGTPAFTTYVNSICPSELLNIVDEQGMNERSLCPWVYNINIDTDRYPVALTYAQCHCPHCIKTDSSGFDRSSGSACRPVYHNVKVLRKCEGTCVNGECRYRPEYESVPVACSCVRPIVN